MITMVVDNDEDTVNRVNEAALTAVHEGMGSGLTTADEYDDGHHDRPHEYEQTVGVYVRDELIEAIGETSEPGGVAALLALELVSGMDRWLGEHYLPDPDDYREWLGE